MHGVRLSSGGALNEGCDFRQPLAPLGETTLGSRAFARLFFLTGRILGAGSSTLRARVQTFLASLSRIKVGEELGRLVHDIASEKSEKFIYLLHCPEGIGKIQNYT